MKYSLCFASWISVVHVVHDNGEYPGHSKNLNYIVSYLFKEHVGNVE